MQLVFYNHGHITIVIIEKQAIFSKRRPQLAVDHRLPAPYDDCRMTVHNRFALSLVLLIVLLAGGIVGFSVIEGWAIDESIYMTLITVTTVGFQEVRPLSQAGRYFMIVFLVFSVATVGYALSTVAAYIFEGQIISSMRRRCRRYQPLHAHRYAQCIDTHARRARHVDCPRQ
ncbi:MAG: two pore domain potassium channel family protein [Spirochaetaceae bacterium]|nr:MAG: two pore domain potassium channel family protein [Spirochaetaceae bacterium]